MSFAIRAEGLGKRYNINRGGNAHRSLRDLVESLVRRRAANPKILPDPEFGTDVPHAPSREFWALKDVSFEVAEGERVGVIGANGAGKSTLLKLLSRITTPTEGRIEIHGKVSSLLEVGTGFHPDLTGRENIFLNGAILGMSSREIRRKFDQIVDFSGVEKFIDTPVKHFSSGMYVRLAFAVSAWLDPDILIVDEVLAVGDAAFQKKCAARMSELTKEGRTVLFVSHSMATVNQMCQKALYLEHGRMISFAEVESATVEYQRDVVQKIEQEQGAPPTWHRPAIAPPCVGYEFYVERQGEVEFVSGHICDSSGEVRSHFDIDEGIKLVVAYRVLDEMPAPVTPNIHVFDEFETRAFLSLPAESGPITKGVYTAECVIPPYLLNTGRFTATLAVSSYQLTPQVHFAARKAVRFEIVEPDNCDPRRHGFQPAIPGLCRPRLDWTIQPAR